MANRCNAGNFESVEVHVLVRHLCCILASFCWYDIFSVWTIQTMTILCSVTVILHPHQHPSLNLILPANIILHSTLHTPLILKINCFLATFHIGRNNTWKISTYDVIVLVQVVEMIYSKSFFQYLGLLCCNKIWNDWKKWWFLYDNIDSILMNFICCFFPVSCDRV